MFVREPGRERGGERERGRVREWERKRERGSERQRGWERKRGRERGRAGERARDKGAGNPNPKLSTPNWNLKTLPNLWTVTEPYSSLFPKPEIRNPKPFAQEREFLIDNLLVRIHLIIEMILVDRPCAMGI